MPTAAIELPAGRGTSVLVDSDAVVGVLMAGGGSRRMGSDKAALPLGGRPLARWAAATVAATSRHRVQSGGAPIGGLDWKILSDLRPGSGPAAGIETALASFPGAAIAVCAVDSPFVPPALLRAALALLGPGAEAAVPWFENRWHPLVAAYSPAILPALTEWLDSGRRSLQQFLDTRKVARIEPPEIEQLGEPATLLTNINTPEDLSRAEVILSGAKFL